MDKFGYKTALLETKLFTLEVGQTTNLKRRLEEHIKGRSGSGWTKLYKIVHLIETIDSELVDSNKVLAMENELVLKYMSMYGWQKVRGGCYNLISEAVTYQTLLKRRKKDDISFEL